VIVLAILLTLAQAVSTATPTVCAAPFTEPSATYAAQPQYPAGAVKQRISVSVLVEVTIDPNGAIADAKIFKSSGDPYIDSAALTAARKSTFAAGTVNCTPAKKSAIMRMVFNPPDPVHVPLTLPAGWVQQPVNPSVAGSWQIDRWQRDQETLTTYASNKASNANAVVRTLEGAGFVFDENRPVTVCGGTQKATYLVGTRGLAHYALLLVPKNDFEIELTYMTLRRTLDDATLAAMMSACVPD